MNPNTSAIFIRRLREERERAGLSQNALARLMSDRLAARIDPTTITRMEKGERAVKLDDAVAAAGALGLPLSELLSVTGSDLDSQLQEAHFELANAEAALEIAAEAVRLRQGNVDAIRVRLVNLQEQEHAVIDAEVQQELAEDLRSAQWPE